MELLKIEQKKSLFHLHNGNSEGFGQSISVGWGFLSHMFVYKMLLESASL